MSSSPTTTTPPLTPTTTTITAPTPPPTTPTTPHHESLLHQQRNLNSSLFQTLVQAAVKTAPKLSRRQFLKVLTANGLLEDDERLIAVMEYIKSSDRDLLEEDVEFIRARSNLVERALNGRLIIPDFVKFTSIIDDIYHETLPNVSGNNADYIPQLAKGIFFRFFFCFFRSLSLFRSRSLSCSRSLSLSHLLSLSLFFVHSVDPNQFGVAVCTIDGQRYSIGDVGVPFCVQSCSKVITYAIAQTLNGPDEVHRHVGVEPSGRAFNQMCLDERNRNADIIARR